MSINPNQISGTLASADATAILAGYDTIRGKLPFLKGATPNQRRTLAKGGDKSRDFIEQALAFAAAHPEVLPANFDATEYAKDGTLYAAITPVVARDAEQHELIQDTYLLLNSDLFLQSLMIYAYAKAANLSGTMDDLIASMGKRFARPTKTKPTTPTTPPA